MTYSTPDPRRPVAWWRGSQLESRLEPRRDLLVNAKGKEDDNVIARTLDVFVEGHPPSQGGNDTRWKQAVAAKVESVWGGHGYLREDYGIDLTFFLSSTLFKSTCVYNLLKPTIDGMSSVLFAPVYRGKRSVWDREDWRIRELRARKCDSPGRLGVRIRGGSPTGSFGYPRANLLRSCFMGGKPPIFAGSVPLQPWSQRLREVLGLVGRVDPSGYIAVALAFRLPPESPGLESDLDNYCITVGLGVARAVFDGPNPGSRIIDLHARRVTVPSAEQGVQVSVYRCSRELTGLHK